jgi:D-glycero-alpha-D-manno-heptose-7-phosphate kinase
LPARSGLGSSSSFSVGLVNALRALSGKHIAKKELAETAIHIEQKVMREHVGSQDQISASFGGFNRIDFFRSSAFEVSPVVLRADRTSELQDHLMLFFTGLSRYASEIAQSKIDNLKNRVSELSRMHGMVDEAMTILQGSSRIEEFGELLHESWTLKRMLSDKVTTPQVDEIYDRARSGGAIGGKLLGAGGGGFFLLFARPQDQDRIRKSLSGFVHVPFKFEDSGSRIVLYQPTGL